jgi:hypothetical protein
MSAFYPTFWLMFADLRIPFYTLFYLHIPFLTLFYTLLATSYCERIQVSINKAPAERQLPEARPTETLEGDTVDIRDYGGEPTDEQVEEVIDHLHEHPPNVALKQDDGSWSFWMERAVEEETRRTTLREAEIRYRNELIDDAERMLLLDHIRRLRRALGIVG